MEPALIFWVLTSLATPAGICGFYFMFIRRGATNQELDVSDLGEYVQKKMVQDGRFKRGEEVSLQWRIVQEAEDTYEQLTG